MDKVKELHRLFDACLPEEEQAEDLEIVSPEKYREQCRRLGITPFMPSGKKDA
jgi:hypothetical protein